MKPNNLYQGLPVKVDTDDIGQLSDVVNAILSNSAIRTSLEKPDLLPSLQEGASQTEIVAAYNQMQSAINHLLERSE